MSYIPKKARAHTRYRLADGTIVPGATTVLGVLNKPVLITWANQMGLQGIDTSKYVDAMASIGTLAHHMIESYLSNEEPDTSSYSPDEVDKAENAFLKFLEWEKQHTIHPVLVEQKFVSETYRFGGTIDCIAEVDGSLEILDFKTSKAIYPEHIHQVAAYSRLAKEHGHTVKRVRILQIGRDESEGFSERVLTPQQLVPHWKIFKACLEIYRLQKEVA